MKQRFTSTAEQHVSHPEAQLLNVKGLDDVVNPAQLKSGNTIDTLLAFGEEDDWNVLRSRLSTQLRTDLAAIYVGQMDIQNHEVRQRPRRQREHVLAPPACDTTCPNEEKSVVNVSAVLGSSSTSRIRQGSSWSSSITGESLS